MDISYIDISFIKDIIPFTTVLVPFVIEFFFEKMYKPTTKFLKSLFSFIISIILTFAVWGLGHLGLGFLVDVTDIWHVLLWGVGVGFSASFSWANILWVKGIIRWIITRDTSIFNPDVQIESKKTKKK